MQPFRSYTFCGCILTYFNNSDCETEFPGCKVCGDGKCVECSSGYNPTENGNCNAISYLSKCEIGFLYESTEGKRECVEECPNHQYGVDHLCKNKTSPTNNYGTAGAVL